jgi:hypothetical protein
MRGKAPSRRRALRGASSSGAILALYEAAERRSQAAELSMMHAVSAWSLREADADCDGRLRAGRSFVTTSGGSSAKRRKVLVFRSDLDHGCELEV